MKTELTPSNYYDPPTNQKTKSDKEFEKELEKARKKGEEWARENGRILRENIKMIAREEAKKEIKKLGIPSRYISPIIKSKLFRKQKGKCAVCKQELEKNFHIDHIFPYSKKFEYKNGTNNINEERNLRLLCKECNWVKGNNLTEDNLK